MRKTFQKGFTMVEVLISSSIILVAVVALLGVHSLYLKTALANAENIKASYLAEEGIEATRFLRDISWNNKIAALAKDTPYGLSFSGSAWATSSSFAVGEFSRTITVSSVQRNASSDIVSSGGIVDPDTVLVTATVSWSKAGSVNSKSIATYLTNLYGN